MADIKCSFCGKKKEPNEEFIQVKDLLLCLECANYSQLVIQRFKEQSNNVLTGYGTPGKNHFTARGGKKALPSNRGIHKQVGGPNKKKD